MSSTTPRVDLRPDHWEIVRNVLRQHFPMRRVVAFGSRATWTAKEYSDLDLAILGEEPLPLDAVAAMAEGFRESDLPFKVDVVVWANINDHLRDIILLNAVDVQTPEAGPASTFAPSSFADRLHVSARHRRVLEELLREHLPDVEAWAYGSRVSGRCHQGSDLDLVLRGPRLEKIPAEQLAGFADAVRDSTIPFLVEARDWARVPERFQREIEREHMLFAGPPAWSGNWQKARLGDIIRLRRGHDLPKRLRVPGSFPIVSSAGITDCHAESKVRGPGVVIGRYGTLGKVHFIPGDYWPLNTTLYVENFKGNDPRYVSYVLETVDVHPFSDKAAVPGLNRNHLHQAEVPFTSDPGEQRAVAHILGTLDDKIELNRRMNGTLEAMARALFKSWFVDFEPVRAKIAGRDTGLPPAVSSLFPKSLITIDQQDVPRGWPLRPLGELIELSYGKPLRKDKRIPGDFPVFGSGGSASSHVEPLVQHPTVVVGRKGTVGSIHWAPHGCWPIDTTFYVASTDGLPMTYIYRLLQHLPLSEMNTDAAVPGLNRSNAYRLGVPFAGVSLASRFADIADQLQMRIDANGDQTSVLTSLRDTLLPKLVSGEIRVQHAEKALATIR